MSEFQHMGFEYVTLVDRTGLGNVEIIFDGQRVAFKKGQAKRPVPQFLAEWVSRVDQHKVHTTDGGWVSRFAVEDASPEYVLANGEQDCSPIEIDKSKLEGWNVDAYALDRTGNERVIELRRNPADYQNDAVPGVTFSKQR
jgi:hypothetical protein